MTMAAPFSGEELIKRSLFSSLLGLKIKTPKFQNWQGYSSNNRCYGLDYDQPCSSKTMFAEDARRKTKVATTSSNIQQPVQHCQAIRTTTNPPSMMEFKKSGLNYVTSTMPNHKLSSPTPSTANCNALAENYVPMFCNLQDKTLDNNPQTMLLNSDQHNLFDSNNDKISLCDHLAESLFLASPVGTMVSEPKLADDLPKLSSPHDIYQEILYECEPLLDKKEMISPHLFEKECLEANYQSERVEMIKLKSQFEANTVNPLFSLNELDVIYGSEKSTKDISSQIDALNSSQSILPTTFYCYDENLEVAKQKSNLHQDRPFSANSLFSSNQTNRWAKEYEVGPNNRQNDNQEKVLLSLQQQQQQQQQQNIMNEINLSATPPRIRHVTAPSLNLSTFEMNSIVDPLHSLKPIRPSTVENQRLYFQPRRQHQQQQQSICNFSQQTVVDCAEMCFSPKNYGNMQPPFQQFASDQTSHIQPQQQQQQQQQYTYQVSPQPEAQPVAPVKDVLFVEDPTKLQSECRTTESRLLFNKQTIESAAEAFASAVLNTAAMNTNKSTIESSTPQHQKKLMSFINAAGQLSLEELVKLVVTVVKETGSVNHGIGNNNSDIINNSSTKSNLKQLITKNVNKQKINSTYNNNEIEKIDGGVEDSPEKILQRKRQQNNEAAARYRKRQRDAKLIAEDELDLLTRQNLSLKAEIDLIGNEINKLKRRFTLADNLL